MENAFRSCVLALSAIAALSAQPAGRADPLYRSVDSAGLVTFSDVPIDGAVVVQRIGSSEPAKPAEGAGAPAYLALADSFDEAVVQANSKVDLAEHALALARRPIEDDEPLSLYGQRRTRADSQRLEFFKQDVASAHRTLARVLKQRNAFASQRPYA